MPTATRYLKSLSARKGDLPRMLLVSCWKGTQTNNICTKKFSSCCAGCLFLIRSKQLPNILGRPPQLRPAQDELLAPSPVPDQTVGSPSPAAPIRWVAGARDVGCSLRASTRATVDDTEPLSTSSGKRMLPSETETFVSALVLTPVTSAPTSAPNTAQVSDDSKLSTSALAAPTSGSFMSDTTPGRARVDPLTRSPSIRRNMRPPLKPLTVSSAGVASPKATFSPARLDGKTPVAPVWGDKRRRRLQDVTDKTDADVNHDNHSVCVKGSDNVVEAAAATSAAGATKAGVEEVLQKVGMLPRCLHWAGNSSVRTTGSLVAGEPKIQAAGNLDRSACPDESRTSMDELTASGAYEVALNPVETLRHTAVPIVSRNSCFAGTSESEKSQRYEAGAFPTERLSSKAGASLLPGLSSAPVSPTLAPRGVAGSSRQKRLSTCSLCEAVGNVAPSQAGKEDRQSDRERLSVPSDVRVRASETRVFPAEEQNVGSESVEGMPGATSASGTSVLDSPSVQAREGSSHAAALLNVPEPPRSPLRARGTCKALRPNTPLGNLLQHPQAHRNSLKVRCAASGSGHGRPHWQPDGRQRDVQKSKRGEDAGSAIASNKETKTVCLSTISSRDSGAACDMPSDQASEVSSLVVHRNDSILRSLLSADASAAAGCEDAKAPNFVYSFDLWQKKNANAARYAINGKSDCLDPKPEGDRIGSSSFAEFACDTPKVRSGRKTARGTGTTDVGGPGALDVGVQSILAAKGSHRCISLPGGGPSAPCQVKGSMDDMPRLRTNAEASSGGQSVSECEVSISRASFPVRRRNSESDTISLPEERHHIALGRTSLSQSSTWTPDRGPRLSPRAARASIRPAVSSTAHVSGHAPSGPSTLRRLRASPPPPAGHGLPDSRTDEGDMWRNDRQDEGDEDHCSSMSSRRSGKSVNHLPNDDFKSTLGALQMDYSGAASATLLMDPTRGSPTSDYLRLLHASMDWVSRTSGSVRQESLGGSATHTKHSACVDREQGTVSTILSAPIDGGALVRLRDRVPGAATDQDDEDAASPIVPQGEASPVAHMTCHAPEDLHVTIHTASGPLSEPSDICDPSPKSPFSDDLRSYGEDSQWAAEKGFHTCYGKHRRIRWKRGEQIGMGSFGKVFKGLNESTGELFAVKQIGIRHCGREELTTLETEIELMKDLNHRHIVRYCGTDRGLRHLYIFLEYVPGGSIASMLKQFGVFGEGLVRRFVHQIMLGMCYLHDKGIIHRDIKGANVLVTEQGIAKLADFGCSKQFQGVRTPSFDDSLQTVRGSIPWMAPEMIKQTGHGRSADVWSVGATMIEMFTARYPWPPFTNSMAAMYHVATATEPPAFPETLSPKAHDFLSHCLRIDPDSRMKAGELLGHPFLEDAAQELEATSGHGPGGFGVFGGVVENLADAS